MDRSDMADEGRSSGGGGLMEPAPAPDLSLDPVTAPRKPRGRPLGSKNKPKPPVFVTRESEAAMRAVVLELAPGCDVVAAVAAFARRRNVGVSVLCGRGAVAAVTLRLAAASSAVTLHGRFEVLALSGTVLPPWAGGAGHSPAAPAFSVSLAGAGGQVIGGTLAGEMTATDGMIVVAAVFRSAEVHRLPAAGGAEDGDGGGRGREEGWRRPQQQLLQVAASGADVAGLGGYGGGGQVGQQLAEMGLWGQHQQPTPSRGPVHPLPLHRF